MSGIYMIINKINGKKYIGLSNNMKRRKYEHFAPHRANSKMHISKAITKYGRDKFEFITLENCTVDKLAEREQYWIKLYKPEYNSTEGGDGNTNPVSDEVKKILSLRGKEQWARMTKDEKQNVITNNLTGPTIGVPRSKKTKEKLRKANLGKKQSRETILKRKKSTKEYRKKFPQTNKNHKKPVYIVETKQVFSSVKECAKWLKVHPSNVSNVLRGRQKTTRGYKIKYYVECRD